MQLTSPEHQALTVFLNAHIGKPVLDTLNLAIETIFDGERRDALMALIANRSSVDNLGVVTGPKIVHLLHDIALFGEVKELHISLNQRKGSERLAVWMCDGEQADLTIRHNQGTFSRAGIAEGREVESGILRAGDVLFVEYWQNGLQAYALLRYSCPGTITILYCRGFTFTPYAVKLHSLKEEADALAPDGTEHNGE
jgi:hypothetical protein